MEFWLLFTVTQPIVVGGASFESPLQEVQALKDAFFFLSCCE